MNYKIVSDSGVNLRKSTGEVPFASVALTIRTDEREFVDDCSLNVSEMVSYLGQFKGKSGTACPSVADWMEAFGDADRVFCVTLSSALSGSYNSARLAKEDYESLYPDRKVYVVDSISAGSEMELLVEKLQEMIAQGVEFDEICSQIQEYSKHTGVVFSLESLKNLANNGRVNPVIAKLAGVLGIRVVGYGSDQGELEQKDKCRGEKKAISSLYSTMKEFGYAGGKVLIDHCENEAAAEMLKKNIAAEYPQAKIRIGTCKGLCSFYAEKGGLIVGYEKQ